MKKIYSKPTLKVIEVNSLDIICTSLDGEADPNKPALARGRYGLWDDEDF